MSLVGWNEKCNQKQKYRLLLEKVLLLPPLSAATGRQEAVICLQLGVKIYKDNHIFREVQRT